MFMKSLQDPVSSIPKVMFKKRGTGVPSGIPVRVRRTLRKGELSSVVAT